MLSRLDSTWMIECTYINHVAKDLNDRVLRGKTTSHTGVRSWRVLRISCTKSDGKPNPMHHKRTTTVSKKPMPCQLYTSSKLGEKAGGENIFLQFGKGSPEDAEVDETVE